MIQHIAASVLLVTGCSKEPPAPAQPVPGSAVAVPAASVFGWWQVPDVPEAEDIRGGAIKLTPDEMIAIFRDGKVNVRACATEVTGDRASISGCGPTATVVLDGDKLAFDDFTMTRASGDVARRLEAEAAAGRPPPDICDRARRCYTDAMGSPPDEAMEFGSPRPHPSHCEGTIKGVIAILTDEDKPVPASCQ